MSMSLLITGGCGFIGSNFVRHVLAQRPGWRVTNLDALTYSGNLANLADIQGRTDYRMVQGDVCDGPLVESLIERSDAVVHLAAESHVDRSIADAGPFVRTNVAGVQTLLDAARRARAGKWTGRLLLVSTDEVYGSLPLDQPDQKFTEHSSLRPSSPYAASKAAGDLLALAWRHTFGLDVVIARCSNNFGPHQYPEKVIPLFVTNLLSGEPVPLYADGRHVRDWIHVEDHCAALLCLLERGHAGETYNIGARNERSNLELTRTILQIMGCGEEMIRPVADRLGHDLRYAIDPTKLERDLAWKPTRSAWPAALEETVRWYAARRDWWQPLKRPRA